MSKLHPNGKVSANGSRKTDPKSTKPDKSEAATSGRDAGGRFAPGNAGGPGNPMARKVASLRKALLDSTTPEQIMEVAEKLRQLAIEGDVPAAKLFYAYTLGKPTSPTCDPDRVNQHEWMGYEEEVFLNNAISKFTDMPTPDVWLLLVRLLRATNAEKLQRSLFGWATGSEKELAKFHKKEDDLSEQELSEMLQNMGEAKNWDKLKATAAAPQPAAAKTPPPVAAAAQKPEKKTAPTPSTNGSNGTHARQPQTAANGTASATNGKKPTPKQENAAKTPSPNGSNRVAAWLPKGQRPRGKVVPRF